MKASLLRGSVLLLAASVAACSTIGGGSRQGAVEATRFHLGQPVARSTIAVDAADAADRNNVEFPFYRYSVESQLRRLGWTVVPNAQQSEQIALIDVEQGSRLALSQGRSTIASPRSAAAGSEVATQLEVSIRRRSDQSVFWEGRAQTAARAGTDAATPRAAVERLAQALFSDFPGESGRTISAP
ncbi:MAG TPA: DUF4136 domain-containing protein [Allosphingosinicella sp.]|uniref:DUF4136 domain-containing protein n=1 Tax=Allosphingosinicella sp. TaxID=2823234 RepID=UPI002EDB63B9